MKIDDYHEYKLLIETVQKLFVDRQDVLDVIKLEISKLLKEKEKEYKRIIGIVGIGGIGKSWILYKVMGDYAYEKILIVYIDVGKHNFNIFIPDSKGNGETNKQKIVVIDTIRYAKEKAKFSPDMKFFIDTLSGVVNVEIRERYLATILRLADVMDIERRSRSDPRYIYFIDIARNEPSQIEHWAFKLLIDRTNLIKINNKYIVESFVP